MTPDHASADAAQSRRRSGRALIVLAAACAATLGIVSATHAMAQEERREPFSFSKDAERERAEAAAEEEARVAALVTEPCQKRIKNRKILLLLAERGEQRVDTTVERFGTRRSAYERTETSFFATQERYGPHVRTIDTRLRALGLRTYTPEQIRAQIAQAEIDAYFRNDPEAALAASRRLAADYVLRGEISTVTSRNRIINVDEVAVNFDLSLSSATTGRQLAAVSTRSESFSGTDTLGTALRLVRKEADPLVAKLYNDFCRNAAAR